MSTGLIGEGYTRKLHEEAPYGRICGCKEDLEHDGKCQNAVTSKKNYRCPPCSSGEYIYGVGMTGWHYPYPCGDYKSKGHENITTQCNRCGWDKKEH